VKLSYLQGVMKGDGYLENLAKSRHRKKGRPSYEISISDSSKEFIEQIQKLFKELFNKEGRIRRRKNEKLFELRIFSKRIHWILSNAPVVNKKSFIKGIFDAEGFIYKEKRGIWRLGVTNKDRNLLRWIKQECEKLGIHFGKIYQKHKQECWEMRTGRKESIEQFAKQIGFEHPRKKEVLRNFLHQPKEQP